MKIIINEKVKKELKYLQKNEAKKILDKISLLWWTGLGLDIKKLQPHQLGLYRLRVGNYRIVFSHDKDTIQILKIDTRENIYDNM